MKRWWRRMSLHTQLALVVAVCLSLLLVCSNLTLLLGTRQFALRQTERQLRADAATAIAAFVASPAAADGKDVALGALADSLTGLRTIATVYGPDGALLARGDRALPGESPRRAPLPPPRPANVLLQRVLERQQAPRAIVTNAIGTRQMMVLVPVQTPSGVVALQLATPLRQIDDFLADFRRYLVVGTVLIVACASGLAFAASSIVLRPLGLVVRASKEVAQGDYGVRLNLPQRNELGRVGDAFDNMVARTAESFAKEQRFVADAAHELRTPLTALGGSVEMLQIGAVDEQPERRRRLLANMGDEVDRLTRLVNQLLLLHTLDASAPPEMTACDLQPILVSSVEQMRLVAPQHRWVLDLPSALVARGNADQLRQVFVNLLTNAYTYTPEGGTITVHGSVGAEVVVAVADTGIGIDPAHLPNVEQRLYRADRARTRGGGFGLGLAIVRTIVDAHGGTITLNSTVGVGTTVTVRFPALRSSPSLGNL